MIDSRITAQADVILGFDGRARPAAHWFCGLSGFLAGISGDALTVALGSLDVVTWSGLVRRACLRWAADCPEQAGPANLAVPAVGPVQGRCPRPWRAVRAATSIRSQRMVVARARA